MNYPSKLNSQNPSARRRSVGWTFLIGCIEGALLLVGVTLAGLRADAAVPRTVNFGNKASCLVTNGQTGNPASTADNILVALYWAPLGSSDFMPIGAAVRVGIPAAGLFAGGTRTIGLPTEAETNANFQVRGWDGAYASYQLALQQGAAVGESAIVQMPTGNPGASPPGPPRSLALRGLKGFSVKRRPTTLTVYCPTNKEVSCTAPWTFDSPTASTTCSDTNVTLKIINTVTNAAGCSNQMRRTWSLTDTCGNSNVCSQTVTVLSDVLPLIFCGPRKIVHCADNWSFDQPVASYECGIGVPEVTIAGTVTNENCPQVMTRTWVATNPCNGWTNTCSQEVVVLCPTCPVLTLTKHCPPYPVPPGGLLTYTATISNVSSLGLTNVTVLNDQPAPNTPAYGPVILLPGASATFTGSYRVPACSCGPHTDTLTATATGPDGLVFTASATASCPGTNYMVPGDLSGDGIVDQDELNAVLANYWAHSPWIYMTNTRICNGFIEFALTNATGWNFTVLSTTNFTDWTVLPEPAYPVYQFHDPAVTNAPFRFYRLRYP